LNSPATVPLVTIDGMGHCMKSRQLHVSHIPLSATDDLLATQFSQFGTVVSATILRDRFGTSLQFAIVTMSSPDEVETIVKRKRHVSLGGVFLNVWEGFQPIDYS
jgi:RNA recognition motif-containing protein